jgi:hypothetical protein
MEIKARIDYYGFPAGKNRYYEGFPWSSFKRHFTSPPPTYHREKVAGKDDEKD